MNNFEMLKERLVFFYTKAALWYSRASRIFMLCGILLYLICCMIAGGPVSPVGFIAWLNHCCQWGKG